MNRIDDWLNPIAVKELRQAVRGRFVAVAVILSLIGQLLAIALLMITTSLRTTVAAGFAPAPGAIVFMALYSVLFTICIFLIPAYTGIRMAAERGDTHTDLLFITTIRPRTIVFGKLITVVLLVVLIFSASLPFLVFSYVLRGIDLFSILVLLAVAFVVVISHSVLALFLGALPASKPFKVLVAVAFFLGTFATFPMVFAFESQLLRSGFGATVLYGQFLAGVGAFLATMLVIDAILIVVTIALITPAVANRALAIRVMLAVMWAISLGAAALATLAMARDELLRLWAVYFITLISLVLLSASGERESWAPRVARTIPNNPLRRVLAFLFYSGNAGGVLWSILFYAATIVSYNFIEVLVAGAGRFSIDITRALVDAALCVLAYTLTATLIRRKLLSRIPPRVTWAIALSLFVLLALIPGLIALVIDAQSKQLGELMQLATFANPFPMASRTGELRDFRTLFLLIWAALAFAFNARSFMQQAARFRRFDVKTAAPIDWASPLRLGEARPE
ncbi:MAG: hypothetical protein DMF56_10495 [Acidobacteria bacterium]|nr:MAG: hypothetical protein DMF56_10495 [Acidobacteriota bacterium]